MNRKHILWLLLLALMPFALIGCSSDDDETTYTDYCYMKTFSLGSMKRTLHTTATDGSDSTYTTTFSGTLFPMTIDQRNLTIENKDSLPYATNLSAVLVTATFEGVCAWRKADITNAEDTTWTTYSSSDSLDLTEPLEFAVVANDGNSYRRYLVKVNVHQEVGDSISWYKEGTLSTLDDMATRRAFFVDGKVVVIGQTADGVKCATHTGEGWTLASTGIASGDVDNIQQRDNTLFMADNAGTIYSTTDGTTWTACGQTTEGLRLAAATDDHLYGLTADGLFATTDYTTWTAEQLDDMAAYLPAENIRSITYNQGNGLTRVLLMGKCGSQISIWTKFWGEKHNEEDAVWSYFTPNGADLWHCPVMPNLNVLSYDDGLIAFGGESADGKYAAMDSIFYSADNGVTWKAHDDMDVNAELRSQAQTASYITATVDADNYLWVFVDHNVWRGRLNRMGFLRQDPD